MCLLLNFAYTKHPYKNLWLQPFLATSGASRYYHLKAQFTDSQIVKLDKLLRRLIYYEYLFPPFGTFMAILLVISKLCSDHKMQYPSLFCASNFPTIMTAIVDCRISYSTAVMFVYIVQYYANIMQNISSDIKLLQKTQVSLSKADKLCYESEKANEIAIKYIANCRQLYHQNLY